MLTLVLYSRPECCLCEDMETVLTEVRRNIPFTLEKVNIDTDPELKARFGYEIPVLFINGRKAFKYRLTAGELHRRLARESASSSS